MKYEKEYQIFVKEITDKFILMVTGELPIQYFCGQMSDGPGRVPTEKEQQEFFRENNKYALKWLKENMITYDEWESERDFEEDWEEDKPIKDNSGHIEHNLCTIVGGCPKCGGDIYDGTGTGWQHCYKCSWMG